MPGCICYKTLYNNYCKYVCMYFKCLLCTISFQKMEIECKEKDLEIQKLHNDVTRLGRQVQYLNKKVNTIQDHLRGKKVSV